MRQRALRPRPTLTLPAWWDAIPLRDGATRSASNASVDRADALSRVAPRIILIVANALLVGRVAMSAFRAVFSDRSYPAVVAGDVDVGGMTVDEAVATARQRADALEQITVTFHHDDQTWTPTWRELGATVDVDTTVAAAYALGREENAVPCLDVAADLLRGDQTVPMRVSVDPTALDRWVDRVDAAIRIDGTDVAVSPDAAGTVVDRDAAMAMVLETVGLLRPATLDLPTQADQPAVTVADLEESAASLRRALSAPVVVTFDGRKWDLAPADLAPFVRVETDTAAGRPDVRVTLARAERSAWLREVFAGEINRSPADARIAWSAGFDASLLQWVDGDLDEWGDLKFENDTGGYLLVQAWTDYPYHFVEIHGHDDGRTVDIGDASVWEGSRYPADLEVVDESLPAGSIMQTEWPRLLAEATFAMTITYTDGVVNEQEFTSYSERNGNVWTVSLDMAGSSPAA